MARGNRHKFSQITTREIELVTIVSKLQTANELEEVGDDFQLEAGHSGLSARLMGTQDRLLA